MADSDDDTLATFGTPVEPLEEDAPRKKAVPIHEQVVTDSEGRRRFHGAFTGGFSAGYFNTVGTKEGWQPSTFVSSRSKKAGQSAQKPEDFMDDDDIGDFGIAPKKITTREEFKSTQEELESRRKRTVAVESSHSVIPGEPPLQDLVVPVRMSIGVELLKRMGWKEGQGVGPKERRTRKKVYGCSLPLNIQEPKTTPTDSHEEEDIFAVGLLFAPKDVDVFTFTPKDDKHGLGYKGLDPSTALISRGDWLGTEPAPNRTGKRGITGQAFGVGAFEEDDSDIYATDRMSNYDRELTAESHTGLHGWSGPPKENTRGGALSIFIAKPKAADHMKCFLPPVVPRDFNCTHKFKDVKTDQTVPEETHQKRKKLNASDRGEMLGEEPIPVPKKSVFEYIADVDKARLSSTSKNPTVKSSSVVPSSSTSSPAGSSGQKGWSSASWCGHSDFKPFAKDSAKQARYEEYLKLRQGEQVSGKISEGGLTEWEREREKEEFSRSAALYRPMNTTMAARFTSAKQGDDHNTVYEEVPAHESAESEQTKAADMKMYGKLTRDKFEWHPNRVLCKRFNIPDPYPGSDTVGVPKRRRPKFTLANFITPQTQTPLDITSGPSSVPATGESKSEELGATSESFDRTSAPPETKSKFSGTTPKSLLRTSAAPETKSKFSDLSIDPSSSDKQTVAANSQHGETEENIGKKEQPKRPPMDLFKAIFAESSSETSDNEEDNEGESESLSVAVSEAKSKEVAVRNSKGIENEQKSSTEVVQSDLKTVEGAGMKEHSFGEKRRVIERKPAKDESIADDKDPSSSLDNFGPTLPPSVQSSPDTFGPTLPPTLLSSPDTFRPAPPPLLQKNDSSLGASTNFRSKKGVDDKRRKHKRKGDKKQVNESSDSEDERRRSSKHKEKKKHKHKHKNKHREEEKSVRKERDREKPRSSKEGEHLPDDKQILDKLKKLQNLKSGKRMRAVDFM